MALNTAFFLVTRDIVKRAGLLGKRYIAPDGRFILDSKDLSRVRFTAEEYIYGLHGVEMIDSSTAKTLIAQGGYNMTPRVVTVVYQEPVVEEFVPEDGGQGGTDGGDETPAPEEPVADNASEDDGTEGAGTPDGTDVTDGSGDTEVTDDTDGETEKNSNK